jgi:signal transduction histidine kinase
VPSQAAHSDIGTRAETIAGVLVTAATERWALRRLAELIADQAPADQVFAMVAEGLDAVLGVQTIRTLRFEPDGTATLLAARGPTTSVAPGTTFTTGQSGVIRRMFETGLPMWIGDIGQVGEPLLNGPKEQGLHVAAAAAILINGRVWGAVLAAAETAEALPRGSEEQVALFAELLSMAISNIESRAKVVQLAAGQSALRRVAVLVAQQASTREVFSVVAEELGRVFEVEMVRAVRRAPDATVEILAAHNAAERAVVPPGGTVPLPKGSVLSEVLRTRRPVRREYPCDTPTPKGGMMGARSVAGSPMIVNGHLWGAIVVGSTMPHGLPLGIESRVAEFAELLSTSISNIESRANVDRLVAEQSALQRIATLVAREHPPDRLFGIIAEELGVLLDVDASIILEYDGDGKANVLAVWGCRAARAPLARRLSPDVERVAEDVFRTASSKLSDPAGGRAASGSADCGPDPRSIELSPITVAGTIWGAIGVVSRKRNPFAQRTQDCLKEFGRQAATAVANAKSRADLAGSRMRIVRAGDEARRRFERDLHDGAQQRLVGLRLELQTIQPAVPAQLPDLQQALLRLEEGLTEILDDLRELSRGIHPAVLSEGGLSPALRSLARRSPVPVDVRLEIDDQRYREAVEVAAYYVVSEALANTAKHAAASQIQLDITHRAGWLELTVRDDGKGGAHASSGSGLTGLVDRVEALGGVIELHSPQNAGTTIRVRLPDRP